MFILLLFRSQFELFFLSPQSQCTGVVDGEDLSDGLRLAAPPEPKRARLPPDGGVEVGGEQQVRRRHLPKEPRDQELELVERQGAVLKDVEMLRAQQHWAKQ